MTDQVKVLDRTLAAEIWEIKRKKRRNAERLRRVDRVGAPPEFDIDGGITAAAKAVAERGVDDTCARFIDRVYLELQVRHIKAPGNSWMYEHMTPIYKRAQRRARALNR
jgi:hypothetical protein